MSLPENTARLAVLRTIRDELDKEIEATRERTWQQLAAARAALGAKSVEVRLPDGTKVGTCAVTVPKTGVEVDTAEFVAWCEVHYPGEIVHAVRDSFRRSVLSGLVESDGEFFYRGTLVPWAKLRPAGEPTSFSYRPDPGAAEAILDAYRAGRLTSAVLPALGAAPQAAEEEVRPDAEGEAVDGRASTVQASWDGDAW